MLPERRALIIGVTGQDGNYLAKALIDQGVEVFGCSRNNLFLKKETDPLSISSAVNFTKVDVLNLHSFEEYLHFINPTEIYNLSGISSVAFSFKEPELTHKTIVSPVKVILGYLNVKPDVRFFNSCSGDCFGNIAIGAANEQTTFMPLSPYAEAKCEVFKMVSKARNTEGINACSGLLFNHESVLRRGEFFTRKLVDFLIEKKITDREKRLSVGNVMAIRDWGWSPEYMEAVKIIMVEDILDDYVIATKTETSILELIEFGFKYCGLNFDNAYCVSDKLFRPTEINRSVGDNSKIVNNLGWKPHTSGKNVIKKMIDFHAGKN